MPGAHKIGAAISGPRIAGGKIMGARFFLILLLHKFLCKLFMRNRQNTVSRELFLERN